MTLGDKPIADLVLLSFVGILGFLMIASVVGLSLLAVFRPDIDLSSAIGQFGNVLSVLTGAVLGYVAGRRAAALPLPEGDSR